MVGLDSSHADHLVRLINTESRFADARIVALIDDDADRAAALAAVGDVDHVGSSLDPIIGSVDGAIIGHRAGSRHRAPAEHLLAAGIPVFVDKPLAASVADAEAILATATRHSTPVTSWSALRFVPGIATVSDAIPDATAVSTIAVSGPADPRSPYDGLFFYGVHVVEAALALCAAFGVEPDDAVEPTVSANDEGTTATWTWAGTRIRLHFVDPAWRGAEGFGASVTCADGRVAADLVLDHDYLAPVIEHALAMFRGAAAPRDDELMRPVRMIAAVAHG